MSSLVDWEKLSRSLGTIHGEGSESTSSSDAQSALEIILGVDVFKEAVDHYIKARPGYGLAYAVLKWIRPWSGMLTCWEIYNSSSPLIDRTMAVCLLKEIADRRALPWIPNFFSDPDPGIQMWGSCVLKDLLWFDRIEPEQVEDLICLAEAHDNNSVREQAAEIREFLHARKKV